jgi:hypothetical protein
MSDEPRDSVEQLMRMRDEAIRGIPSYLRHPIYLPTDRVPLDDQIEGLHAIRDLYAGPLDTFHRPALQKIKAARTKKRCFVIGNGPSLLRTDLTKLKDEVTFVMNGFFLKMPELDWTPTFYVCEDHLVAEDRATEINALKGPTKFFPASLRYVIRPDEHTVFYDHRPRKSYPNGFDFSFDADVNTYTGGTVTFSCLQLAAYMGFEEIYLIGVDASYAIPADATLGGAGRIKELDMTSDDPNHFHPDYFGKGKRWHEPNVHTMLDAYREARRTCDARGVAIYNATVGGKLEVFPRVDYYDLFPPPPNELPKVLIFDLTRVGDGTATGELKCSLLEDWPKDRIFQVFGGKQPSLGTWINGAVGSVDAGTALGRAKLKADLHQFQPDVILYRPVPNTPNLHELAMEVISACDTPLVTWIMDDWPAAIERSDAAQIQTLDPDLRSLFRQSAGALSIGTAMSEAFGGRYGQQFQPFANGIDRMDWDWSSMRAASEEVLIRYSGSLAEDMGLESLLGVAQAVEALGGEGVKIRFEVKTRQFWADKSGSRFKGFRHTRISTEELAAADYRTWLSGADIVLICYNFDDASKAYVRYSVANKLPECLASGAALLAIGPPDIATMGLLRSLDCGVQVETRDPAVLRRELAELAGSREKREALVRRARQVALDRFDMRLTRQRFVRWLTSTIEMGQGNKMLSAVRTAEGRLWNWRKKLEDRGAQVGRATAGGVKISEKMQNPNVSSLLVDEGCLQQLSKKFGDISVSLRSQFLQRVD